MTDALIKIFNQLYVGFNPRDRYTKNDDTNEWDKSPVKLAFITPYEDNVAGRKRMATVDAWSKERIGGKYVENEHGQRVWEPNPRPNGFESIIIDNKPMAGFKLAEEVRRTYWGGGNVVWRIESPLGWEFEISSPNLARIITDCGIAVGGEIQGRCIFGRMGKDNILIPEGSELWKQSVKDAETIEARSKHISKNKVEPGSICLMKTGETMTYLGLFYVTGLQSRNSYEGDNKFYHFPLLNLYYEKKIQYYPTTERYHVFKTANDKNNPQTIFVNLYKEKRVIEITGNDPNFIDITSNQNRLNGFRVKTSFASANKNSYNFSAFCFSIEEPVSSRCIAVPISALDVRKLITFYPYGNRQIKFTTTGNILDSNDFTICTGAAENFNVNSMVLLGNLVKSNGVKRDPVGNLIYEFERNSIKVAFESKYIIDKNGNLTYYAAKNLQQFINSNQLRSISPRYTFDGDEILNQAIDEMLQKFSFNVLQFEVTTDTQTLKTNIR